VATQVWNAGLGALGPPARALWRWVTGLSRQAPRRLRLCASLPLGERRFVAVIEFEKSRFLVGGTSSSLVLLADLRQGAGGESAHENQGSERRGAEAGQD